MDYNKTRDQYGNDWEYNQFKIIQSERVYSPPLLSSLRGWIRPALSSTQFPVSNNPTEVKVGTETCGICDLTNSDQHIRPSFDPNRICQGSQQAIGDVFSTRRRLHSYHGNTTTTDVVHDPQFP